MIRYLKGPIPWKWMSWAMVQPGKALHVAIHLWAWSGIKRSKTVSLNLTQLGISKSSASRGLAALEYAGLVSVQRLPGSRSRVTILHTGV